MIAYLILLSLSSGALCSFGVLLEATISSGDGVPRTVVATGEWARRFASDVRSLVVVSLRFLSFRASVRPNHDDNGVN